MNQLKIIADNIETLTGVVNKPQPFWNTQWFAALIGATSAIVITWLMEAISIRRKRMSELYEQLSKNSHWLSPEPLLMRAGATLYGHTRHEDGVTIDVPEKAISEKMIIEFRKRCKYWNFPISRVRYLFGQYEQSLKKIRTIKAADVKSTDEYKKSETAFLRITDLVQRKTGESEWTVRYP